jgi:Ca2+-transporting ATPase
MEGEGHRVMAAAFRDLDPETFDPTGDLLAHITDLELTSLVAMVDPPRDESKAAVRDAQNAHIRVRMVTGDDVTTGAAIARQLGIPGTAMLGTEFAALSEPERLARIDDIGVVGRVAPEHKVLLVETLRKRGEVVAMTGDGVNDAPAIKSADIGIAMGSGTQVAKNASRMILSDDNFATIIRAVEEGRKVFDNLNKFIRYVIIELVAYIITFLGASILNIAAGQPFSPSQILYINFLVNAPLGVALGMDKQAPGLMNLKPRPRDATIMTRGLLTTAGLVGLFMAVCTLALISYGSNHYDSLPIGSSMGVTAFSLLIIVAAFQARSVTGSVFAVDTFDNRNLNWTAVAELVLAVLITQLDVLRRMFGTVELTLGQWALALAPAVLLIFLWELGKLVARSRTAGTSAAAAAPGR